MKKEYALSFLSSGREEENRVFLDEEDLSESFMEWFVSHFAEQDGEELTCGCSQYIMTEEVTIISASEAETGRSVRKTLIDELDLELDDDGDAIIDEIDIRVWFGNEEGCRRYCESCGDHHEGDGH
jgi:hypothetical protein